MTRDEMRLQNCNVISMGNRCCNLECEAEPKEKRRDLKKNSKEFNRCGSIRFRSLFSHLPWMDPCALIVPSQSENIPHQFWQITWTIIDIHLNRSTYCLVDLTWISRFQQASISSFKVIPQIVYWFTKSFFSILDFLDIILYKSWGWRCDSGSERCDLSKMTGHSCPKDPPIHSNSDQRWRWWFRW